MAGAFALVASPCAAQAQGRATNQLPVEVTVTNSCTVSAAPLVFSITTPANVDIDRNTSITVRCPPNIPYNIEIDNGLHSQGNNRRVRHQTINDYLTYDIYRDPPRAQIWGRGNVRRVNGNSGATGTVVHTVYGRLNARTSMRAGRYSDLLTVQLNF